MTMIGLVVLFSIVSNIQGVSYHDTSSIQDVPVETDTSLARYLVYNPNGGVFKLILGWAIPVEVPMSVVWGHNFQFQYKPVDNATQLAYPVFPKPKLSRQTVYQLMEQMLNVYGLDGQNCVLKTLCESSRTDISHDSIFGHLLSTILTPSPTVNSSYYEAWLRGQSEHDCEDSYAPCEMSLLDLISVYV
uniref:Uncharacterized protein n=2 Tax=Cacopsylla melanoneura TaxID=428564 RepID=A0A8D8Q5L4_9HEMI